MGAGFDADADVTDAGRARAGRGKLCRDGDGGEGRVCKGRGGAAIGDEERVIVSGIGLAATAGLEAAATFSEGGGLVAL